MAYEFVKEKGRVAIFLDGEFHHQQFRKHWAYRDPARYIAQLIEQDREAAADRAEERAARVAAVAGYAAVRAARAEDAARQRAFEF